MNLIRPDSRGKERTIQDGFRWFMEVRSYRKAAEADRSYNEFLKHVITVMVAVIVAALATRCL